MRKNRIENGKRADLLGSNPHSKGEFFSRSIKDFFERIKAIIIINKDKTIIIMAVLIIIKIIYFD